MMKTFISLRLFPLSSHTLVDLEVTAIKLLLRGREVEEDRDDEEDDVKEEKSPWRNI